MSKTQSTVFVFSCAVLHVFKERRKSYYLLLFLLCMGAYNGRYVLILWAGEKEGEEEGREGRRWSERKARESPPNVTAAGASGVRHHTHTHTNTHTNTRCCANLQQREAHGRDKKRRGEG
jgi:hypothetical protein